MFTGILHFALPYKDMMILSDLRWWMWIAKCMD